MQTPFIWTLALGLALTLTSSGFARPLEQAVDAETALEVLLEDDSDGDGTPDITEVQEQTNPLHAEDYPGAPVTDLQAASGVPVASCFSSMRSIAGLFCIHNNPLFPARSFPEAAMTCKNLGGRIATYLDLFAVYVHTNLEPLYNPLGRSIGPELVGDDQALCGNRSITVDGDTDTGNFEGICNKTDKREWWCVGISSNAGARVGPAPSHRGPPPQGSPSNGIQNVDGLIHPLAGAAGAAVKDALC